jgi:hypothetical protein
MQGNELMPGGQNILLRGARLRAPHILGGDRPLNPLNLLGISKTIQRRPQTDAFRRRIVRMRII